MLYRGKLIFFKTAHCTVESVDLHKNLHRLSKRWQKEFLKLIEAVDFHISRIWHMEVIAIVISKTNINCLYIVSHFSGLRSLNYTSKVSIFFGLEILSFMIGVKRDIVYYVKTCKLILVEN